MLSNHDFPRYHRLLNHWAGTPTRKALLHRGGILVRLPVCDPEARPLPRLARIVSQYSTWGIGTPYPGPASGLAHPTCSAVFRSGYRWLREKLRFGNLVNPCIDRLVRGPPIGTSYGQGRP